jgi:hypothetical protein
MYDRIDLLISSEYYKQKISIIFKFQWGVYLTKSTHSSGQNQISY